MSYASTLYSLILPLVYLFLLVGSLATFSSLYRRRQAAKAASLAPWFPPHLQRNVYLSLLELQANPTATTNASSNALTTDSASSPKIPDSLLKAALLRRATEDIHRLIALRAQKPAATQLLQRGSVGDELMQRLQRAEAEMEAEIKDVVAEANALAPQQMWGTIIFQSASEAAHREMLQRKLKIVEDGRETLMAEWETRREQLSDEFMREVGMSAEAGQPKARKESSDEDAPVIVEGGGPVEDTVGSPASGDGGSAKKKKKGKK